MQTIEFNGELHTIPGYRVKGVLGQGGMATVYIAEQLNLCRDVALKVMAPQFAATPGFAERFLAEGRMTARLNHPNIVTVHDVGQHQGLYYLAAELLPGGTLKERLPGLANLVDKLRVLRGIARGLGYAHEHKIVHRDVKPVNIMFRDEAQPVVTDFGIAKSLDASHVFTQAGGVIGTPHYMSPEQAQGLLLDGRSDLYALGIMMYEVLVGKVPFDATDPLPILYMHVQQKPPMLPDEFSALQAILDRLLAKLPEQRFQTAAEFGAALEPFLGKLKTGRVTVVTPERAANTELVARDDLVTKAPPIGPEAAQTHQEQRAQNAEPLAENPRPHPSKSARSNPNPNDALSVLINLPGGYSNAGLRTHSPTQMPVKSILVKIIGGTLAACALAIAWYVYSTEGRSRALRGQGPASVPSEAAKNAQGEHENPLSIRNELLNAVRSQMARGALIEPADNCALALVSRMLAQAPTDSMALGLLKDIGTGVSVQVRERWAAGKRAEALSLLRAGLDKLPNDLELNRTRADLQLELDRNSAPLPPLLTVNTNDVAQLLERAQQLFAQSQWTAPQGDNAVEVLYRVLALQPNQPKATSMLNDIAVGYEKVALTWRERGRPDQALAQVRNGLKAQPGNVRLLRLEQSLR